MSKICLKREFLQENTVEEKKLKVFRDCTRTCVIAQCAVPRQPTLSCLFYLSKRTSGFAIPNTELEKPCTLFTEINHCILIRWLLRDTN